MTSAVPTILTFPDERLTQEQRVEKWAAQLCRALDENYVEYHKRSGFSSSLDHPLQFKLRSGRKYYKIVQTEYDTFQDRNEYRDSCVHAFIDKKTGEVYKPAGWAKPAQHVRYDLRIIREREDCLAKADWAGGYLYMR